MTYHGYVDLVLQTSGPSSPNAKAATHPRAVIPTGSHMSQFVPSLGLCLPQAAVVYRAAVSSGNRNRTCTSVK